MGYYFSPKRPTLIISISIIFLLSAFVSLFGKNPNKLELVLLSTILLIFALIFFRLVEKQYLYVIDTQDGDIEIKGYLGIRRIKLKKIDFKGYEVQQRLDQVKGTQNAWILVTKSGKKILFAEGAYENYHELVKWIEENFEFLSYKEMRYAKFMGKSYVYMTIIGGVIYFLLAIIKLLKLM